MTPITKNYFKLHFIVFIWGFTGVLGKLITMHGGALACARMGIAFIALVIFMKVKKISFQIDKRSLINYLGVGLIIATHWATFFIAIKVSNISIALVCMSASALFMSLLEPLFLKRKIIGYEMLFGAIVIAALIMIFKIEMEYALGIILALISAFLAALFTAINAVFIKKDNATKITTYEMLGGFIGLIIYLLLTDGFSDSLWMPNSMDWIYIIILGVICTAYAFVESIDIMKVITPFTVAITVNLEPIYAIIMALLIFGEEEYMSAGFYFGATILITTIIANAVMKQRSKFKKKELLSFLNKNISP